MYPTGGPTYGGTVMTFSGDGFVSYGGVLLCMFDGVSVPPLDGSDETD